MAVYFSILYYGPFHPNPPKCIQLAYGGQGHSCCVCVCVCVSSNWPLAQIDLGHVLQYSALRLTTLFLLICYTSTLCVSVCLCVCVCVSVCECVVEKSEGLEVMLVSPFPDGGALVLKHADRYITLPTQSQYSGMQHVISYSVHCLTYGSHSSSCVKDPVLN